MNQVERALKDAFVDWQGSFPEFRVCCPLPDCGDVRHRLGINVLKRIGHCFNCNARLDPKDISDLLSKFGSRVYEPNDFESLEQVFRDIQDSVSEPPTRIQEIPSPGVEIISAQESGYSGALYPIINQALRYLAARGLNPQDVSELYRFQVPLPGSFLEDRIILPVYEGQRLVYWQARSLADGNPKYLNPSKSVCSLGKSHYVFNLDQAADHERIIICEGIFSAISCGPQAVAIFGKELSDAQAFKIVRKRVRHATIVLDPGAEESAIKIAKKLNGRLEISIAHLETGDPNEVSSQELQDRINFAQPFEDLELDF